MFNSFAFRDVGGSASYSPLLKRDPLIIGGAIAGASALINGLLQHRANKQNIQNQNALWNEQLRQQNFLNANGALIQRQALQRAGLNPNAEFGTSANLQTPAPQKSDVVAPQIDTQGLAQMIQQQQLIDAQAENLKANTGKTEAETYKINEETKQVIQETANLLETNGILKFQNKTQQEQFDKSMANLYANTQLQKAQKQVADWDADLKSLDWELYDQTFEERKQTYIETLSNIIADNELKDSEKKLNIQRVNESVANVEFTQAQIRRMEKLLEPEFQKLTNEANVAKEQSSFIIAQASMVRTENQWYEFRMMCESLGLSKRVVETLGKYTPLRKYMPKPYKPGGIR